MRITLPMLPPSVNRKNQAAKQARQAWREQLACYVCEALDPHARYVFRFAVVGKFENADGRLSKRDHMNIEKPLIDDVCSALGIDDRQVVHTEGWKVHSEGDESIVVIVEEEMERRPMWL